MTATTSLNDVLQLAIAASAKGDSDGALALLKRAIHEEPEAPEPHFLAAAEYASRGDLDFAEQEFGLAVLLDPGMAVARYQLGLLQYSSGRVAAAQVSWLPLLDLADSSPLPHWVQGFMALAQDRYPAARQYFEAGLAQHQDNPPMASDIRKVLLAMDALAPADAADGASASAAFDPTPENELSHVLLSNYRH